MCSCQRHTLGIWREKRRESREDRGKAWGYTPRETLTATQQLGKARTASPLEPQGRGGVGGVASLIPRFHTSSFQNCENRFLNLSHQVYINCYSSPKTAIQKGNSILIAFSQCPKSKSKKKISEAGTISFVKHHDQY